MPEIAHWDCWGWCGDRHISRAEPNSTPEAAMDLLLEKARLMLGEQDWSTWQWSARTAPGRLGHQGDAGSGDPNGSPQYSHCVGLAMR